MEKKKLPHLPHELIIEILLRLPVKSLICFKCVCKSWFSLISNPHFANSNFQLITHTHRIMCKSESRSEFCSIDFEALNLVLNYDPPHPTSLSIKFSLPLSDFPVQIKGSCRGFILLIRRRDILLWNPSTGFKTQIPSSPFVSELAPNCQYLYGFGYDQSRDDYLVVVLSNDVDEHDPASSQLEFFSVRDNRWKEIEGTLFAYSSLCIKKGSLLFNGAIHWLVFRDYLEIDVIVAFDLMDRKLFEIPLPEYFQQELPSDYSGLSVFGEFFSLWTETRDFENGTIELWVMKEYKLNSSWTKKLVIPLSNFCYFNPICSTNNGDIIGTTSYNRLVKYDNNKGQLSEFHSFPNGPSDDSVLYTESLLSLPSDNEQDYKLEE